MQDRLIFIRSGGVLHRRWMVAGLTAVGLMAGVGAVYRVPLWQAFARWRAARFVAGGFEEWQAGRWREADLAFQSATALEPSNTRAWQLMARMYLQRGRTAEGQNIFRQLIAAAPDVTTRQALAELYLDSLIGTGAFAQASEFAAWEFAAAPRLDRTNWAAAAFHSARLTRQPSGLAGRLADPRIVPAVFALQAVGTAYAAQDPGEAYAQLDLATTAELGWPLQFAAARLALDLGDPGRARVLLYAGPGSPVGARDLVAALLFGRHSPPELRRLAGQLFPPGLDSAGVIARVGALLPLDSPQLAELVAATGNINPGKLDANSLSALWVLWEINCPGRRDNPWTKELSERIHRMPIALKASRLTPTQFVGLINNLPFSRDTVISLMSRVDPAEQP